MLFASDFRRIARDGLRNRWGVAVGTGLVASILGGGSYYNSNTVWRERGREYIDTSNSQVLLLLTLVIGIFLMFAFTMLMIKFFIGGAIALGYAHFNKKLVMGMEVRFQDLFSRFHIFWKGFCMQLLMGLYTLLWTLLFIIPGIIATYSYAMTPYILEEYPNMTANEAIGYSKLMMVGNKWRLFCLQISFIGWEILALLTLGIGYLWITPYTSAAQAAFYFDVARDFHPYGIPRNN